MKRILHLTISSEIGGGPEHIYQLIKGTSNQFESHIACPKIGDYFDKFAALTSNRVVLLPHRKFDFKSLYRVIKYVKFNNIDLLHSHGKGAGFYCRLICLFINIRAIHTPHGINKKIENGLINRIYIKFERMCSNLISHIIFVSKSESEYAKTLNLWSNVPSVIINNGTPVIYENDILRWRSTKRKELGFINNRIVITASRFDFQKNTKEFCEIAFKAPHITFIILGDGGEKRNCEAYCSSLNISNVYFLGNTNDPLPYFAMSDVYLSTSRWEGLSMAILESMALGLPVVATKVIGNIDLVINGETGFLYNLGEIDEAVGYLDAIFDLNTDKKISKNSKKFHQNLFSSDSMCEKTVTLYQNTVY